MFADNGEISGRQLKRQMLLELSPVLLLFLSGNILLAGRSGVLGLLLGGGILQLYLYLLSQGFNRRPERRSEKSEHAQRKCRLSWIWVLFWESFLVLTGAWLLQEGVGLTASYLLPGTARPVIACLILLAAAVGVGSSPEQRGRMAELACSICFYGILFLLALAALHARTPDARQMPAIASTEVLRICWEFVAVGIVITAFPEMGITLAEKEKKTHIFGRVWLILTLLLAGTVLILYGTYGYHGVNSLQFPLQSLMSGTNLPGKFLERFDILWMAFFLFGILFAIGSTVFYGVRLTPWRRKQAVPLRILLSVLTGIVWLVVDTCSLDKMYYINLVKWIYAPIFILYLLVKKGGKNAEKDDSSC
ncbi:MAG: GerAB/ArcD/ProY family transporter [Lachnospiraceae bacterium]|nr:GerAB/ArcD/ProY family transporter [Lachnospiraceae bacterium]